MSESMHWILSSLIMSIPFVIGVWVIHYVTTAHERQLVIPDGWKVRRRGYSGPFRRGWDAYDPRIKGWRGWRYETKESAVDSAWASAGIVLSKSDLGE